MTLNSFALGSGAFGTYKTLVVDLNSEDSGVRKASLNSIVFSLQSPLLVNKEIAMISSVLSVDSVTVLGSVEHGLCESLKEALHRLNGQENMEDRRRLLNEYLMKAEPLFALPSTHTSVWSVLHDLVAAAACVEKCHLPSVFTAEGNFDIICKFTASGHRAIFKAWPELFYQEIQRILSAVAQDSSVDNESALSIYRSSPVASLGTEIELFHTLFSYCCAIFFSCGGDMRLILILRSAAVCVQEALEQQKNIDYVPLYQYFPNSARTAVTSYTHNMTRDHIYRSIEPFLLSAATADQVMEVWFTLMTLSDWALTDTDSDMLDDLQQFLSDPSMRFPS